MAFSVSCRLGVVGRVESSEKWLRLRTLRWLQSPSPAAEWKPAIPLICRAWSIEQSPWATDRKRRGNAFVNAVPLIPAAEARSPGVSGAPGLSKISAIALARRVSAEDDEAPNPRCSRNDRFPAPAAHTGPAAHGQNPQAKFAQSALISVIVGTTSCLSNGCFSGERGQT